MCTHEPRDGWTISDSEWNGFVKRCETYARNGAYLVPLLMILPTVLGSATFLGLDQWKRSSTGEGMFGVLGVVFWIAIVPINVCSALLARRRLRRHARAAQLVRGENGCVCPACGESCAPRRADGFAPRCRHGISRDAQSALIECWQAMARRDIHAVGRLMAGLPASDRPRGLGARIQRTLLEAASTAADRERPLWQRYRAGLLTSLPFLPVMVVSVMMPMLTGGAFMPMMMYPLMIGIIAAAPFFTMSGATRSSKEERCSTCRQLLARERPARCTECGSDLSLPAAVESVVRGKQWKFIGVGVAVMLFALTVSTIVSLGVGANLLPTPVLLALAPYSDSSIALSELEQRTLSPTDRARLAQILISRAEPSANLGGGFQSSRKPSNFVLPAVAAGELPASAIDDALRTMVELDSAFKQTPEGTQFVLTPRFGDDLFDRSGDAWVVFRGVSFDGAEPIGASTNPIDRWTVDPIWRSGFRRQNHPTEFSVPCPADARVACWKVAVVLLPFATAPKMAFDRDGNIVRQPGTISVVEIEGTTDASE